jgi:mono/diheme cytochrome c family protein
MRNVPGTDPSTVNPMPPMSRLPRIPSVRLGSLFALLSVGVLGFATLQQGPGTAPLRPAPPADGEEVYMSRCMSCHQMNGQGVMGVFPPLDGSEWVTGDKGRLIRIVLHGLTGETEVNGVVYSGAMPPWGAFLSDEEVADVLTYVRAGWSNEADAVEAAEVARVRAATTERKQPWTAEELEQEANLGIPAN